MTVHKIILLDWNIKDEQYISSLGRPMLNQLHYGLNIFCDLLDLFEALEGFDDLLEKQKGHICWIWNLDQMLLNDIIDILLL